MRMLAFLLAACCWAQTETTELQRFDEVAVSGDGARVAWVEDGARGHGIFVQELRDAGGKPRRVADGDHVAWSPDGRRIAFLARRDDPHQAQLYVAPAEGGAVRRLTLLKGYLTDPAWSPDGRRIALLFAENAPGGGGPLEAVPAQTGAIENAVFNQRIAVVDASKGAVRQATPPALHVYEYDWSPDSGGFVFTAAPGPGDNNWWIAQLYAMRTRDKEPRALFRPGERVQLAVPRWSPDGRTIAFIGGLMSDEGFTGGDLYTIPAEGGEPRNLTPKRQGSPSWAAWVAPGRLLFTESVGGGSTITAMDAATGRTEALWTGDGDVHAAGNFPNFAVSRDGRTSAVVRQSWKEPPEVWAGATGQWRRITGANAALKPAWGEARSITWKNEGFDVQGWLLFPQPYDPARRYPLVVSVHGGPAGAKKASWPAGGDEMAGLSARGYFVFYPNPRGSYGQGEAFVQANVKDLGYGDLRDILAGVDEIVKTLPVDGGRVGITGWSYGGYMSMWAVTRTDRFRAAVAGAGIANWQSYYGENFIDRWMIPYFGASVYDDPAVYAKSSPITFIRRVKTPTLVLVGERDGECPAPQSFEFWHALKTLGVETQLVVYPGEGHMFRAPAHRNDATRRTAEWFDRYLK